MAISSCGSSKESYTSKNYSSSSSSYDDDKYKVSSYELSLSTPRVVSKSSNKYIGAEGKLTNNSKYTVSNVTLSIKYKNSDGDVVKTSSVVAVGSEGLAPKESTTWEDTESYSYSSKDDKVVSCSASILDYKVR